MTKSEKVYFYNNFQQDEKFEKKLETKINLLIWNTSSNKETNRFMWKKKNQENLYNLKIQKGTKSSLI